MPQRLLFQTSFGHEEACFGDCQAEDSLKLQQQQSARHAVFGFVRSYSD